VSSDDSGIPIIPIGPSTGTATKLPGWIYTLRPLAAAGASVIAFLIAFAKDPVGFVTRIISYYLVGGILTAGTWLIEAFLYPFDLVIWGLEWLQRTLVEAFRWLGLDILGALVGLERQIAAAVEMLGPAAPVVAVAVAGIAIFGLYRAGIAGIKLIPGGDALLSLIGR
jgi:uncharacterized membrane protein